MSGVDSIRQTAATAAATGRRWCSYCMALQPADGFRKIATKSSPRWICTGCLARRKKRGKA